MSVYRFKKAAVLGAGVMGAQIAAHCANANVPVILFDLAAKEGDPDAIVRRAIAGLKKLEPAPLAKKTSVKPSPLASRSIIRALNCSVIFAIRCACSSARWASRAARSSAVGAGGGAGAARRQEPGSRHVAISLLVRSALL